MEREQKRVRQVVMFSEGRAILDQGTGLLAGMISSRWEKPGTQRPQGSLPTEVPDNLLCNSRSALPQEERPLLCSLRRLSRHIFSQGPTVIKIPTCPSGASRPLIGAACPGIVLWASNSLYFSPPRTPILLETAE